MTRDNYPKLKIKIKTKDMVNTEAVEDTVYKRRLITIHNSKHRSLIIIISHIIAQHPSYPYAILKRCVFSAFLKDSTLGLFLSSSGSLFHSIGALTPNALFLVSA